MSREHRRYLREQKTDRDNQQVRLDTMKPRTTITMTQTMRINPNTETYCPFCLTQNQIRKFFVSTKKGISNLAKCPVCNNGMRLQTIISMTKWTPEQFAEFVVPYIADGFWKKVQYQLWKNHLYEMGWSSRFWNKYKELKGSSQFESEEDSLNRRAREEWESDKGKNEVS